MIINETYNLEEDDNIHKCLTLNEYNKKYITRINLLCNKNNITNIAVGIELFDLLSNYNLFSYYFTKERKNKGIIELVGSINSKTDVYLDFRLKNNQIIMGNLIDIKHYINCTLRKEKIEKIEKNVSYKK